MNPYPPRIVIQPEDQTMEILRKILHYANPVNLFRKNEGEGINLRVMHGINKVSMTVFLLCVIYLLIRTLIR